MRKKRKASLQIQTEPRPKLRKKRPNQVNINKLISEYLIHCYIYYESGFSPIISDQEFDELVEKLSENYHLVEKSNHPHKRLIKEDSLKSYTGFGISGNYPNIVKMTATQMHIERNKC